ncbi:MAG TPA: Rossmann-like and DUF2520 domain-containing protein [Acidimicrobiales bacterium]|jgi:predicted short-subunit dehydrogenase-like oxidoreductase (DUF2520 family)|nr:Rossmann-like and DUF2520 domain-containing protein [Acidimicrobiales bacterium]
MASIRIIGPGRAGTSFAEALRRTGHLVDGPLGRRDDISAAADGVDALILAVPDDEIAIVAELVTPRPSCVVLHLSGSLGLDVLAPHERRASLHPLVPLPTADIGADRLLGGVTIAVAGDVLATVIATSLDARVVAVADEDRAAYHAAACIAANHVVALLGQVERLASSIGLDVAAFLGLARAAIDDVATLGPRGALTGPASRGDWSTIVRHLDALAPQERATYGACVALCLELAAPGQTVSPPLDVLERVTAADVAH